MKKCRFNTKCTSLRNSACQLHSASSVLISASLFNLMFININEQVLVNFCLILSKSFISFQGTDNKCVMAIFYLFLSCDSSEI